jgi:hypothetical protein
MIEAMQATEPYVDVPDNVDNRVNSKVKAVDDTTDIEGEEVTARDEAADGLTAESQQTNGNIPLPSKQGEMRTCGRAHGSEGEWAESKHTPPADGMYKTATLSSPKRTKKLKF